MADKAAFQVIVLGPTGGPREDSVTGLLVRSTSTKWSSNSVISVDAGTLLAGIIRTLEKFQTETSIGEGPFADLNMPHQTAQANAAHIFREILGAILITHPHLDHLAGLAINTPMLEAGNGPKPLAALPSVVAAIKNHMFNDIIWPNLSDEDGGAGLLTYQRLVEGGNPRFGRGESKGYVRACEGLLARCLSVSHGRCRQRYHPESGTHHRIGSGVFAADQMMLPSRAISIDHTDAGVYSPARSPRLLAANTKDSTLATVESSAFFIRDSFTGNEIIVFGDVEPDSISQEPRNMRIWEVAAPKIASGNLRAIFIECSYDDSVDDCSLYGHLCPRHLIAELKILASRVTQHQQPATSTGSKRKRTGTFTDPDVSPKSKRNSFAVQRDRKPDVSPGHVSVMSDARSELPDLVHDGPTPSYHDPVDVGEEKHENDDSNASDGQWTDPGPRPLDGLSVYIIHIKEDLNDGPHPSEQILKQLRAHGEESGLGCEFYVPGRGEAIWI